MGKLPASDSSQSGSERNLYVILFASLRVCTCTRPIFTIHRLVFQPASRPEQPEDMVGTFHPAVLHLKLQQQHTGCGKFRRLKSMLQVV